LACVRPLAPAGSSGGSILSRARRSLVYVSQPACADRASVCVSSASARSRVGSRSRAAPPRRRPSPLRQASLQWPCPLICFTHRRRVRRGRRSALESNCTAPCRGARQAGLTRLGGAAGLASWAAAGGGRTWRLPVLDFARVVSAVQRRSSRVSTCCWLYPVVGRADGHLVLRSRRRAVDAG
jgi:hypothetical protein